MPEIMPPTRPNFKNVVYGTTDGTTVVPVLVDAAGNLQADVVSIVLDGRVRFRAQLLNDAGAEVELTGLTANRWYALERLHVVHSAGTAANIRPRVYDTTAGAAGAISDIRYEDTTLVATPIDNTFVTQIPFTADANGKIYFVTGVDAGADNTVDYDIILKDLGA